jgi:hypothetical protein
MVIMFLKGEQWDMFMMFHGDFSDFFGMLN